MQVEHDESQSRFVARVDGDEAELVYMLVGGRRMDIQHTFVPESARGLGIAEALAEAAFQWAGERKYLVVPTCPFIRRWLSTQPEYAKLVDRPYAKFLEDRPRP